MNELATLPLEEIRMKPFSLFSRHSCLNMWAYGIISNAFESKDAFIYCILKKNLLLVFQPSFWLIGFFRFYGHFCYIVWTEYAFSLQARKMEDPSSHYKLGKHRKLKSAWFHEMVQWSGHHHLSAFLSLYLLVSVSSSITWENSNNP